MICGMLAFVDTDVNSVDLMVRQAAELDYKLNWAPFVPHSFAL